MLGEMYMQGKGVNLDARKALEFFSPDSECLNTSREAAKTYKEGIGSVAKKWFMAVQILKPLSRYPIDQFEIGKMYETGGPGLRQDKEKALYYFDQAGKFLPEGK